MPSLFGRNPFPRSAPTVAPSPAASATSHLTTISVRYRKILRRHPALAFGVPFVTTIVAGSFFLTPATAIRYERFDRKTHMLDREEALGLGRTRDAGKSRGRFKDKDIREEYWRLAGNTEQLDNWEPVRVKRLPGEPDGTFD